MVAKQMMCSKQTQSLIIFCVLQQLEAVVQRCSVKKVFLKISQNSQENTCTSGPF